MSPRWLALFLLLLGSNSQAYQFPIEIIEYVEDARVVAFINQSDLDISVHWQPGEGPPPINIENVISSTKDYAESKEDLLNATLTEIKLRQIPHHEAQWHYMVKLQAKKDNKLRYHYLVVLMNGKIIPAIREPVSIK